MSSNFKLVVVCGLFMLLLCVIGSPRSFSSHQKNAPAASASPVSEETLNRFLEKLISSHPTKEISGELYQAIDRFEIATSWTSDFDGQFQLVPRNMQRRPMESFGNLIPVLFINPRILSERPSRYAQLVVYHEYIHYRQWRDRTISEETFVYQPLEKRPSFELARICKQKWHAEKDAYHRECGLAARFGWTDVNTICRHFETPTFESELLRALVSGDVTANVCAHVWINSTTE